MHVVPERGNVLLSHDDRTWIISEEEGEWVLALAGGEPGPWIGQLKDYLCRLVEQGKLERSNKEGAVAEALEWLRRKRPTDVPLTNAAVEGPE